MLSDSDDERFHRRLNSGIFPGVCSSYHLHHVAGKVVALSEFEAFGEEYAADIVSNAKALGEALASEGFDVLAEDRGYTASHQVVTRHGEVDSGAGRDAAATLEQAGIVTNMNNFPCPNPYNTSARDFPIDGFSVNVMKDKVGLLHHRDLFSTCRYTLFFGMI